MSELKASQEEEIAKLKENHEDEVLTLKEKLDAVSFYLSSIMRNVNLATTQITVMATNLMLYFHLSQMRRRSLATATTSAPSLPPDSRDSARFSSTESEYASRALSTWKSSAKTATTIVEVTVSNVLLWYR